MFVSGCTRPDCQCIRAPFKTRFLGLIDLSAATNSRLALGLTAALWTVPGWHLVGLHPLSGRFNLASKNFANLAL
jgi:hypothetical protein